MNQNVDSKGFPWSELLESSAGLYLSAAQGWQKMTSSMADLSSAGNYIQAPLSMWRAFMSPWAAGEPSEKKADNRQDWIEAFLRVMGPGQMSGDLSKLLWSGIPGLGLENMKQDAVKTWTEIYEKAVQPLFKAPRVGLTRVFQEKISKLADRFNTYQTTLSEFQLLLSGPMENSFADMKEKLDALRAKGEGTDDYQALYNLWIKTLEGHFMKLFRSEEYQAALARLLDETAAFRMSGDDVLTEILQFLPIPTNKEMDDLYKDIYALKKAAKQGAKKIEELESALAEQTSLAGVQPAWRA
jgi:class III poly(R)-hydroxyalkanoic acid synthase PhaE subunit